MRRLVIKALVSPEFLHSELYRVDGGTSGEKRVGWQGHDLEINRAAAHRITASLIRNPTIGGAHNQPIAAGEFRIGNACIHLRLARNGLHGHRLRQK